jgi:general secretion pathway protein D
MMKRRLARVIAFGSLAGLLAAGGLSGCAAPRQPLAAPQRLSQLRGSAGARYATLDPNTNLGPARRASPQMSYGQAQPLGLPPGGSGAAGASGGDISLNFADTDIRTVIAQILGDMLHVNYVIDPSVHGTATFHTAQPLTRTELLPVLQALLGENGAALVQTGTLYRVVPAATAATTTNLAGNIAEAGSTLVPLRYAAAGELAKVLQPFIGAGGKIIAAPNGNAVLLSGDPADRATMLGLVRAFDIDQLAGQSYALLPVSAGDAKDMAGSLQTALTGKADMAGLRIVPMEQVNAILAVANRPDTIADVRRVFDLIERSQAQTTRSWHVYYLQDSQANNLAYVLQQAFTPDNVTAQPNGTATGGAGGTGEQMGGAATLGSGSGGISTSNPLGGAGGGIASGGIGSGGGTAAPAATGTPAAASSSSANPLLGGLGGGGAAGGGGGGDAMRIIPDQQNNALLIYATQSEDNLVNAMLRKIDVLPLEVRIDATIAEVQLNNNLQYGTQFFFQKAGGINGILNNGMASLTTPANVALNSTFPGFVIGGSGVGGAPLAISALQAVTKVRVLSSPELLVLNNHTAQLQVGSLVPYLTSSSQSTITSGAPVISSIQYQPTGVIMKVTPRVDRDGLVELQIAQNVSSVSTATTTNGIQSPTFLQRSISSSVVVQDGQTIGLAGLITDSASHDNQGIPWLKDIPVLGALAGTQNNTRVRDELLVLLTPHVVYNTHDVQALTADMERAMPGATNVPAELTVPDAGLSDPNLAVRRALRVQQ